MNPSAILILLPLLVSGQGTDLQTETQALVDKARESLFNGELQEAAASFKKLAATGDASAYLVSHHHISIRVSNV
jgi:hypothetical protein